MSIGALLAVVMLWSFVPASSAVTSWQSFGSSTSNGRGSLGSPFASIISTTTKRNPTVVRLVFRDHGRTRNTNISWDIYCWSESTFQTWSRSSSGNRSLPQTILWDPPNWVSFCDVGGSAYHAQNGKLSIVAQARYP